MGIEDDYIAYCLDQAVGFFGRHLQAELDRVEAKNQSEAEWKQRQILDRYLGEPDNKPSRGSFADPAAMMK
jgi:hypothetical protein